MDEVMDVAERCSGGAAVAVVVGATVVPEAAGAADGAFEWSGIAVAARFKDGAALRAFCSSSSSRPGGGGGNSSNSPTASADAALADSTGLFVLASA